MEGEQRLRDADYALMDAIKNLIDIILSAGLAKPQLLDEMFQHQIQGYLQRRMPDAVAIAELLRRFATDPQREALRQQIRTVLREPPAGTA